MAGIYSQGGSAGHRYAGWLSEVEAKNFQFGGKVFNGSPSAIYVGSNQVWPWLTFATRQAIRAAFGADGAAVINATNAYLNGIAAQGAEGRSKAQALAGFINEDPMMVCSLGLEPQGVTMPIRWLYADNASCIDTGIIPDNTTYFYVHLKVRANLPDTMFGASYQSSQRECGFGANQNRWLAFHGNYQWFNKKAEIGQVVEYTDNAGNVTLNFGAVIETKTFTNTYECPVTFYVFALHRQSNIFYNGHLYDIGRLELRRGDNHVNLIPFKSATREGMVDLVNATFHPNQGTGHFTDAYTLQDGVTPWTPPTP